MQATQVTSGVLMLAVALALAATLLDDTLLLALPAVLLLFTGLRAGLFLRSLRIVGGKLSVTRETGKEIIRQGGSVAVTTRCRTVVPAGFDVTAQDLVPPGAARKGGKTSGRVEGGTLVLGYELTMLVPGRIEFPGLELRVQDPFFGTVIRCSSPAFLTPAVRVEPFSTFVPSGGTGRQDEAEQERPHLLPGTGIRSFREFVVGDDPRHIDWKLSAKYDRLYVRQYTGVRGLPSVIVLDLPPEPGTVGNALKGAVAGLAERVAADAGGGYLLVIMGANMVRSLPFSRHTGQVIAALTAPAPAERLVHRYRALDPGTVRSISRRIEAMPEPDPRDRPFLESLSSVCRSFADGMKPTSFQLQLARALSEAPVSDLYLFSSFQGDQSHVRELLVRARERGMKVHARIPKACASPAHRAALSRLDLAGVEVC